MVYRSPTEFCAEYAKANDREKVDEFGATCTLEAVTVVNVIQGTARVEARWFICGQASDAGYYDVVERIIFVLAKQPTGWHVVAREELPYE